MAAPEPSAAEPAHLELLGSGAPVTVLAHGLGGCADDCRPWARAMPGTAALLELRGHGRSAPSPENGWDYDTFGADIAGAIRRAQATGAVCVSVSAAATLRLLTREPRLVRKLALVLPATFVTPRVDPAKDRLESLGRVAATGDRDAVVAMLLSELPPEVADSRLARIWSARRASRLTSAPPPLPVAELGQPLDDASALADVEADVLVLAEDGDAVHPLHVAEEIAAALPRARLVVRPHGFFHWTGRDETAALLAAHLTGD